MAKHPFPLDSIAKLYGVTVSQLQPMAGGHFAHVYEYATPHANYILRITPPDQDVDPSSTRAILEWLAYLSAHGGPVPRPIRSQNNNLMELMEHEGQVHIAVAFEKASGRLAEGMSPDDWSNELSHALGCSLGICHRIAQTYIPARVEFKRLEWDSGGSCFNPKELLIGADAIILEKRAQALSIIQSLPKDRDSYGLVHMDLHFGNFFVDMAQQSIQFFDFDDCAYGWYVMDIAMLLFDMLVVYNGLDQQEFGERFLEHVLRGYQSQKPITRFWIRQLPHFLKLLEIGVYVMLYRTYDPSTADAWVSKFMPGRQERIEEDVPYADLDFMSVYDKVTE
jgi:Ser/Thr protein kinase RdoA (MazF antagonist)